MKWSVLIIMLLLSACAKAPPPPCIENNAEISKPQEVALVPPSTKQYVEESMKTNKKFKNTGELLDFAIKDARQTPKSSTFINAVTMYDYIPGNIYKVYTAPLKVTMLSFAKGEKLIAPPQGGDTVRWQLNIINGNQGQQHLVVKPSSHGLKNNLILTTNKNRIYLVELVSFKNSYMAAVKWSYPEDSKIHEIFNQQQKIKQQSAKSINTGYKVKNKRGSPIWRPVSVFDDGSKTYIQFPEKIKHFELPALFIISHESKSQLVNYRFKDNQMIIDRLFLKAELRLGLKKPEIILIKRTQNV